MEHLSKGKVMANGNNFWKKVGIIFGIIVVFAGVVSGYTEVKIKASKNESEISEVKSDIKEIKKDQITLKVQNAQILEMVKYLRLKAK